MIGGGSLVRTDDLFGNVTGPDPGVARATLITVRGVSATHDQHPRAERGIAPRARAPGAHRSRGTVVGARLVVVGYCAVFERAPQVGAVDTGPTGDWQLRTTARATIWCVRYAEDSTEVPVKRAVTR